MQGLFIHRFDVPESAIDFNRHVNNLEYLRWMQEVATDHSTARGWSLDRYVQTRCSWVIRSHHIEYLRPSFAGEELLLATWIADMSEQTSLRRYLFLREADRQVVAHAETLWVFVNGRTGRPWNIPPALREAFTVIEDEAQILAWLQDKSNPVTQSVSGRTS